MREAPFGNGGARMQEGAPPCRWRPQCDRLCRRGHAPDGGFPPPDRVELCAVTHVYRALCRLQPLGVEQLDGIGRGRDEAVRVLVRLEVGEDVVGRRATVATLR